MKKVLLFLFLLLMSVSSLIARDDLDRLTIKAYVPSYEGLPAEAAKLLETKLSQIITAGGVAEDQYSTRFVLTAKVNVITKDIVAGPPQRISQNLEITLMLGDILEDKVYSSIAIPTMGVGTSETKSYLAAIKNQYFVKNLTII